MPKFISVFWHLFSVTNLHLFIFHFQILTFSNPHILFFQPLIQPTEKFALPENAVLWF